MDDNNQRVAFALNVADRLDQDPTDRLAVGRGPIDFGLLAECHVAHLRVGIDELDPQRSIGHLVDARHGKDRRRRRRIRVVNKNGARVVVAADAQHGSLVSDPAHLAGTNVKGVKISRHTNTGTKIDGVAIFRP